MVKTKGMGHAQTNKVDNYAITKPDPAELGQKKEQGEKTEPSLSAILAAICNLKGIIELKQDAVTVDVNLLRADFKKISEKFTTAL
ncbi:hypothetical protein NDU88_005437 [Pleurodeles waltl]|uniref:Uncharacterized protein n=1 Tax=Pleurodeles waltl TaxID=8319 RepID=A0AAV7ULW5_PLEWA|nr:hypothetical protein NDU88_005437 [Pleurodeles waltl]